MSDKCKNKKQQGKGKAQYENQIRKDKHLEKMSGKSHKGGEGNNREAAKDQKGNQNENQQPGNNNDVKIEEPIDTVALFANLKRETDEILKITEGAKNKYSKREITSNWTKYELPADNYDIVEDQEHGADFEELLCMPVSSGHFQFKHEKTWTNDKKINDFKDLFTLNLNYLSSALYCVPFYERNNIHPKLFPSEQVERMTNIADKNMAKFKKNMPVDRPESVITKSLLDKLREPSSVQPKIVEISSEVENKIDRKEEICEDDAEDDELEKMLIGALTSSTLQESKEVDVKISQVEANDSMYDFTCKDLILESSNADEGLVIAKVPTAPTKSMVKIKEATVDDDDDDDELDVILGIKSSDDTEKIPETTLVRQRILAKSDFKKATTESLPETKVDLDKWLDDYLDS